MRRDFWGFVKMCRNFLRLHSLLCYKVNSNLAWIFSLLYKKANISQKIQWFYKKSLRFFPKKLQDLKKTQGFSKKISRLFHKTQCFGGYQPQLASKKPPNKQAWYSFSQSNLLTYTKKIIRRLPIMNGYFLFNSTELSAYISFSRFNR